MQKNALNKRPSDRSFDSNIIPMINVVFLLLIFFMVAGTIRNIHSQDIEIPTSDSKQSLSVSALDITVNQHQEIRLNGEAITAEALGSAIAAHILKAPSNQTVSLKADKRLKAYQLDAVLNTLRSQGIKLITLYSQPASTR